MTGWDLRALRKRLGMGLAAFGIALGYEGTTRSIERRLRRIEANSDEIDDATADRVARLQSGRRP